MMHEYVCGKCGSTKEVEEGHEAPMCCEMPMERKPTEEASA